MYEIIENYKICKSEESKMEGKNMDNGKLKIAALIIMLIFALALITPIWYWGCCHQYVLLQKEMNKCNEYKMKEGGWNGSIVDDDGYTYAIKMPTFLYWGDGNLAIGGSLEPTGKDEATGKTIYKSGDGLIIWLDHWNQGIREVGVILNNRQIYLVDSSTARYADDQPFVDKYQDEIDMLFEKAERVWKLDMPWKK